MIISYAGRLVCVVAVVAGLIHLVVEGCLWVSAPYVMRLADTLKARQRERFLYALQLVPMLAALLVACAVCIPHYVRGETNLEPEAVGWLCISGAFAVGIWYGLGLIRGIAAAARTGLPSTS